MAGPGPVAVAVHGGAGRRGHGDHEREKVWLRDLAQTAWRGLAAGGSALDTVIAAVQALEACGLFSAGRGSRPGVGGRYELDASVMDGATRRAGAVAALQGIESPIRAAEQVMLHSPHVLLAGEGAAAFARGRGLAQIRDEAAWFAGPGAFAAGEPLHGTVGCVALDASGRLAAATSTGGIRGKLWGRVGDSPLIGAGTWADDASAVSCTGLGEAFIRSAAASQVAFRLRLAGQDLAAAASAVLAEVKALGGEGGLIAVDRQGVVIAPFNAEFMAFAAVGPGGAAA